MTSQSIALIPNVVLRWTTRCTCRTTQRGSTKLQHEHWLFAGPRGGQDRIWRLDAYACGFDDATARLSEVTATRCFCSPSGWCCVALPSHVLACKATVLPQTITRMLLKPQLRRELFQLAIAAVLTFAGLRQRLRLPISIEEFVTCLQHSLGVSGSFNGVAPVDSMLCRTRGHLYNAPALLRARGKFPESWQIWI